MGWSSCSPQYPFLFTAMACRGFGLHAEPFRHTPTLSTTFWCQASCSGTEKEEETNPYNFPALERAATDCMADLNRHLFSHDREERGWTWSVVEDLISVGLVTREDSGSFLELLESKDNEVKLVTWHHILSFIGEGIITVEKAKGASLTRTAELPDRYTIHEALPYRSYFKFFMRYCTVTKEGLLLYGVK